MSKLLGIFAHPDDESFFAAGTMAKYAKAKWQVDLFCATSGEAGRWGPYNQEEGLDLGKIRRKELESAATILGVHSVTFLDLKDGALTKLPPGDIEDKLLHALIVHKPDSVITFDPTGLTNHPDHIKISLASTFAFQMYAKLRHKEDPNDPHPPKLYYMCLPESVVEYLKKKSIIPEESHEKPRRGIADRLISTVIDISRYSGVKKKALLAHKSQVADVELFMSLPTNPIFRQEYFQLRMIGINEAFMGKNDVVSDRL